MQARRILSIFALYLRWLLTGMLAAVALTILFAILFDPHGTGPVGEGLIFLVTLIFLVFLGLIFGFLRASYVLEKRDRKQPTKS